METRNIRIKVRDTTKKTVGSGQSASTLRCLFCRKTSENKLTAINGKPDIVNALTIFSIQYEALPSVLDYICYTCLYRVNTMIDTRRRIQRNINATRASHFLEIGNSEMYKRFQFSKPHDICPIVYGDPRERQALLQASQSSDTPIISDVPAEEDSEQNSQLTSENLDNTDLNETNNVPQNDSNTDSQENSRLLIPLYERSELVTDTESGGKINRYGGWICQYCAKRYKLQKPWQKHEQRCSKRRKRPTVAQIYGCELCPQTFPNRRALKLHERSHKKSAKCYYCAEEFFMAADLELHRPVCFGKYCARQEIREANRAAKARADAENAQVKKNSFRRWENNTDLEDECQSFATSFSRSTRTAVTSFYDDFDYLSDSSSSFITNIEVRSKCMEKIIANRIRGKDTTKSLITNRASLKSRPKTRAVLNELNRIDLELEVRRVRKGVKKSRRALKFRKRRYGFNTVLANADELCSECEFTTSSANDMMHHDISVHLKLAWFKCRECVARFTRREYLERHIADHPDYFICHYCDEQFLHKQEITYHMKQDCHIKRNTTYKIIKIISRKNYTRCDTDENCDAPLYGTKSLVQFGIDFEHINRYAGITLWKLGNVGPRLQHQQERPKSTAENRGNDSCSFENEGRERHSVDLDQFNVFSTYCLSPASSVTSDDDEHDSTSNIEKRIELGQPCDIVNYQSFLDTMDNSMAISSYSDWE